MMKIIIGRDPETCKLHIDRNGISSICGNASKIPMDVSRQHLELELLGDKKWKIHNLNDRNVTYVNGISIESKIVSEDDKIYLGNSHYLLNWKDLYEPDDGRVDIRPLEKVWETFNQQNVKIKKRQKTIGLLASIPMGFTMLGGLVSGIASDDIRPIAYFFTFVALAIMIYGFYKRFTDDSIEEQEDIKKQFQRNYICPQCGHFMGYQDYELLIQADECPYCKAKFKK